YLPVGPQRLYTNLSALIIGKTATGRKGTSADVAKFVFQDTGSSGINKFLSCRILSGLSSGEGLIYEVRDPYVDADGETKDEGVDDKRLLVMESEFSRVFSVKGRDH